MGCGVFVVSGLDLFGVCGGGLVVVWPGYKVYSSVCLVELVGFCGVW